MDKEEELFELENQLDIPYKDRFYNSERTLKMVKDRKGLCDENCNECPIINHPNSRMITNTLNLLQNKFGDGVYEIVQRNCPNLTVCYDCRIDDFVHEKGCELSG